MEFFNNISNVINQVSNGLIGVGLAVMILCSVLFGIGSMWLDSEQETFRKAKGWIIKGLICGAFMFGGGTIGSFIQNIITNSGFGN